MSEIVTSAVYSLKHAVDSMSANLGGTQSELSQTNQLLRELSCTLSRIEDLLTTKGK